MMTFERLDEVLGLSKEQVEAASVGSKRPYSDDDQEGNGLNVRNLSSPIHFCPHWPSPSSADICNDSQNGICILAISDMLQQLTLSAAGPYS